MEVKITEKQKKALEAIYSSIDTAGIPPTLAELRIELNVGSNQAVLNILDVLERKGLIKRGTGQARGIIILPLGCKVLDKEQKIPVAGISSAGPFLESLDAIASWIPLRGAVIENEIINQSKESFFAIKVQGDSMINAGINDGDILLVKKTNEFKSNDIVVARCDDGTTVKRFIAESDGRAYLKPENPAYNNIPIYEDMIFDGKVILNLSEANKKL
ncbi:MAG: repressor LexA [Parcubacteria group bacterium CG1_02_40_82]|nr:MAG: repressor LexA [Parcubacteria group bacterium CG1_02_40_82]